MATATAVERMHNSVIIADISTTRSQMPSCVLNAACVGIQNSTSRLPSSLVLPARK
jgi:hypothetical protein